MILYVSQAFRVDMVPYPIQWRGEGFMDSVSV